MNSAVIARQSIRTLDQEPSIDQQLHVLGKIIRDFEKIPTEASHRLCQDLREHLNRVRKDPKSTSDQIRDALGLLKRVKTFDPRRLKIEAEEQQAEEREAAENAPIDSEEHQKLLSETYVPGAWYMHPAPPNDEHEFLRLLDVEKKKRESCPEPEFAVFQDNSVRDLIACASHLCFVPDDLLKYASGIRGPYTHDRELTYGGKIRADVLLCRERLIAGICAPADRKAALRKLRDCVSPLFWELFVERI